MTDLTENELNGLAWEAFCDTLKRAGKQIIREEAPTDSLSNSEGYRYLSRLLRVGLEMHLEFSDPDFPDFCIPSHETAKIGADNPDNLYMRAPINGSHRYRVFGNRGTVHYLSFGCQSGGYEKTGTLLSAGFIDANNLQIDERGDFELVISSQPETGNHLLMNRQCTSLIVRQTFHDRKAEAPAVIKIERLQTGEVPQPLTPEKLREKLLNAANFVEKTATLFANWAQGWKPQPNTLPLMDPAIASSVGGDANILYCHGYWQLQDDEVLVIEVDRIPDCDTWNIQVNNYWMESLDYRHHNICINKHSAHYNADGGVTLFLAHRAPGRKNWLQTASHREGTMCFRWVATNDPVTPRCRVIKQKDINT